MTVPASEAAEPPVAASVEEFPAALASVSAPPAVTEVPLVADPPAVPLADPVTAPPVDPPSAIDPPGAPLVWLEPLAELPDEATPGREPVEHAAARATSSAK